MGSIVQSYSDRVKEKNNLLHTHKTRSNYITNNKNASEI